MTRSRLLLALVALTLACSDDSTAPAPGTSADRTVVLNTFGNTGVTVAPQAAGADPAHIAFDPFDGVTLTLERDSALSTSSSLNGDLLFIADLDAGTARKVQMPALSNPAGVSFAPAPLVGEPGPAFLVALRNAHAVALVRVSGTGTPTTTLGTDAGLCPYDVFVGSGAAYSVDANLDCAGGTYASAGPVRLIRISLTSAERDTISLAAAALGAARAFPLGDAAFVITAGNAEFDGENTTITTPAAVTQVDLILGELVNTLPLPEGTFAFNSRLAEDGRLYVTAAAGFDAPLKVYAIDLSTLTFAGTRASGQSYLALAKATGGEPSCSAASADAAHNVYCVENAGATARVYVFDASGAELRNYAAGTTAADIALR